MLFGRCNLGDAYARCSTVQQAVLLPALLVACMVSSDDGFSSLRRVQAAVFSAFAKTYKCKFQKAQDGKACERQLLYVDIGCGIGFTAGHAWRSAPRNPNLGP
jgi:hypothetical protein